MLRGVLEIFTGLKHVKQATAIRFLRQPADFSLLASKCGAHVSHLLVVRATARCAFSTTKCCFRSDLLDAPYMDTRDSHVYRSARLQGFLINFLWAYCSHDRHTQGQPIWKTLHTGFSSFALAQRKSRPLLCFLNMST